MRTIRYKYKYILDISCDFKYIFTIIDIFKYACWIYATGIHRQRGLIPHG